MTQLEAQMRRRWAAFVRRSGAPWSPWNRDKNHPCSGSFQHQNHMRAGEARMIPSESGFAKG